MAALDEAHCRPDFISSVPWAQTRRGSRAPTPNHGLERADDQHSLRHPSQALLDPVCPLQLPRRFNAILVLSAANMVKVTATRCLVTWLCAALVSCHMVEAYPVAHDHGKGKEEREYPAKGSVQIVGVVGLGLLGLHLTEHAACKAVARQEATMQATWDELHPDKFIPKGDQMRPVSFDCSSKSVKPLGIPVAYTHPANDY
ncbi:hypothetical protein L1887_56059 [Cichorium endivia]|nr:hypothetical protein L1887_56059 [Cichorium endivia]